jgi:hypothetical protein
MTLSVGLDVGTTNILGALVDSGGVVASAWESFGPARPGSPPTSCSTRSAQGSAVAS